MRLWDRARRAYASAEVERLGLQLQDEAGQCVSYLLWAMWAGEDRRPVDADLASRAAALAGHWERNVLRPLRTARRELKAAAPGLADAAREALRDAVKGDELDAERLLLDSLEAMTPGRMGRIDPPKALAVAVAAWPAAPTEAMLDDFARAFLATAVPVKLQSVMSISDEPPLANDEAIQARIAELRLAHQDLDDSIGALAAKPVADQLQIARLKKQKLALRDKIKRLEDRLTPDIIA